MDGEFAFPRPKYAVGDHCGMLLRDYFAIRLMPALIPAHGRTSAAKLAYEVADRMIEEREKERRA